MQNSKEWRENRRVRITASRFGDVLAKPTTKRYSQYSEDIKNAMIGVPDFDDEDKPWFAHGKEWEDEARGRYEWEKNIDVVQVDSIVHPSFEFISCSPDGLISSTGGLEIKCRKSLQQHLKTERSGIDTIYKPQVQGCLWITGYKWWDFVSFYKNILTQKTMFHVFRVEPDFEYFKRLEVACLEFWEKING